MTENSTSLVLPDLLLLNSYAGDFEAYLNAVYRIFFVDFVDSKPTFEGRRLGLKKHPITDGREATFYHMTHEGEDESNRTPDFRRMERIGFPRPMIDDSGHICLKVWQNKRGRDTRILIWHETEEYLVVLNDRGDYILPWTAYMVTQRHKKLKLLKEYEAYKRKLSL